jgi:hypothetical protein
MAPIATWTLYLGSGITVLGTDRSGKRLAAILLEVNSSKQIDAAACVFFHGVNSSCEAVTKSIRTDFNPGAAGTTSPQSAGAALHPLNEPAPSDNPACEPCRKQVKKTLDLYGFDIGRPWMKIVCEHDGFKDDCTFTYPHKPAEPLAEDGRADDIIKACCEVHPDCHTSTPSGDNSTLSNSLVNGSTVELVCPEYSGWLGLANQRME